MSRERPIYLHVRPDPPLKHRLDTVLLRDLLVTESEGREADDHTPIDGRLRRLTITVDPDCEGVADLELEGNNGHPVHIGLRLYGLALEGYTLIPEGAERGPGLSSQVLAMLNGQAPGTPEPPLTPGDAMRIARELASWAQQRGAS